MVIAEGKLRQLGDAVLLEQRLYLVLVLPRPDLGRDLDAECEQIRRGDFPGYRMTVVFHVQSSFNKTVSRRAAVHITVGRG